MESPGLAPASVLSRVPGVSWVPQRETRGREGERTRSLCWSDGNGQPRGSTPPLVSPGALARPPHPASGMNGAQAPAPRTPAWQPETPAVPAGGRLSPSALARLDWAPPPPPPGWQRPSPGVSARVCATGRFTFSLPPPPRRARRLPHPAWAGAGESPQDEGVGCQRRGRGKGRSQATRGRGCCGGRGRERARAASRGGGGAKTVLRGDLGRVGLRERGDESLQESVRGVRPQSRRGREAAGRE